MEKWKEPVTVIIPAFNEESRIAGTISELRDICARRFEDYEIVCVDDGSTDATWEVLRQLEALPGVRAVRLEENGGKGRAVRHGMLEGRGDIRFFTDADLPFAAESFDGAMQAFRDTGCEVVVGSRDHPESGGGLSPGLMRMALSAVFAFIVTRLFEIDIRDTQCGFKGFRKLAAEVLFSEPLVPGYTFDVELLIRAKHEGFAVVPVPVVLVKKAGSKVRFLYDPAIMFFELLKIAKKTRRARKMEDSEVINRKRGVQS